MDAICDQQDVVICGMMEQIQEAGVHSGDSSCVIPPVGLSDTVKKTLEDQTRKIALELGVRGLINIQFAIENETVFILEVNPRASRTVPFVSKAKGIPYSKIATKVMLGQSLRDMDLTGPAMDLVYVKEAVFPFNKFSGTDIILGPEMRSTGEVMGVGSTFGEAYGKANRAAGFQLPSEGNFFLSFRDADKEHLGPIASDLLEMGYSLVATRGTAKYLSEKGMKVEVVNKVNEGRPHVVDLIKNGDIQVVFNTSALGVHEVGAAYELRRTTLMRNLPCFTTVSAARAAVEALKQMRQVKVETHCLQGRGQ